MSIRCPGWVCGPEDEPSPDRSGQGRRKGQRLPRLGQEAASRIQLRGAGSPGGLDGRPGDRGRGKEGETGGHGSRQTGRERGELCRGLRPPGAENM